MITLILHALLETLVMVLGAMGLGLLVGFPLAILLSLSRPNGLAPHPFLHQTLGFVVNALQSIPYIILILFLLPLTRLLVGTSVGTWGALVPLTLAAILLISRMVEEALNNVHKGVVEMGVCFGARKMQILRYILLVEALPHIVTGLSNVTISLIGFSAMAGMVGGGGLGDLAVRYGHHRYDFTILFLIVIILVALVQTVQMVGDKLARKLRH